MARSGKTISDVLFNLFHGRAARVGGRNRHSNLAGVIKRDILQYAQIPNGQYGYLRVFYLVKQLPEFWLGRTVTTLLTLQLLRMDGCYV